MTELTKMAYSGLLQTPGEMNPVKYLEYRDCPHRTLAWLRGDIQPSSRVVRTWLVTAAVHSPDTVMEEAEKELGERVLKNKGGWRTEPERLVLNTDNMMKSARFREILPGRPEIVISECVHNKVRWKAWHFEDSTEHNRGLLVPVGLSALNLRTELPWYIREHAAMRALLTRGVLTDWGRSWTDHKGLLTAGISDQYPGGSFGFAIDTEKNYMVPDKDAALYMSMEERDDSDIEGYDEYLCDCDWCSVNRPGMTVDISSPSHSGKSRYLTRSLK